MLARADKRGGLDPLGSDTLVRQGSLTFVVLLNPGPIGLEYCLLRCFALNRRYLPLSLAWGNRRM